MFRFYLDHLANLSETRAISPFTKTSFEEERGRCTDLVECRPFLFQDVQADVAVVVHVGMEAGCGELD